MNMPSEPGLHLYIRKLLVIPELLFSTLMYDMGVKLPRPTVNPLGPIGPVLALFERKAFTSKHPVMVRFRGIPDDVPFQLESRSGAGWLQCLPRGECRSGGWLVGR